jgi:hypothetical protein
MTDILAYAHDIAFLAPSYAVGRSYLELRTCVSLILIWHIMQIRLFVWFSILKAEDTLFLMTAVS